MLGKWTGALVSAALFALASTASNAQSTTIGQATGVKPQAEGSAAGTLRVGSSVSEKRRFAPEALGKRMCSLLTTRRSTWDPRR